MKLDGERLYVRLIHCKYVHGGVPRSQVEDLYQVCGQAQKSVHWKGDRERLVPHMTRREVKRRQKGGSRLERGTLEELALIGRRMRDLEVDFEITIVQPGLMKSDVNDGQRDLLAGTQLYLSETYAVPLRVVASA